MPWYIFNKEGQAIASCDNDPNFSDLDSRNEFAIRTIESYQINLIELVDGKILVKNDISTKRNILNNEYIPQFNELLSAYQKALITNNSDATNIQEAYQSLWSEYNQKMEEIQNG